MLNGGAMVGKPALESHCTRLCWSVCCLYLRLLLLLPSLRANSVGVSVLRLRAGFGVRRQLQCEFALLFVRTSTLRRSLLVARCRLAAEALLRVCAPVFNIHHTCKQTSTILI